MNTLKSLGQAFKVPEIRKKIIFTVLMLIVFRLGCCIPVPGIDRNVLSDYFSSASGLFGLFDMFSGNGKCAMMIPRIFQQIAKARGAERSGIG